MPGKGGWRAGGGAPKAVVITKASGVATVGLPPAPSWLSASAKVEYRRIGRALVNAGIVTHLDGATVAMHADAVARMAEASLGVAESGPLIRGRDGMPAVNPWVRLLRDARADALRTAAELGLTPASRGRVKPGAPDTTVDSPIARLLHGGADWLDAKVAEVTESALD